MLPALFRFYLGNEHRSCIYIVTAVDIVISASFKGKRDAVKRVDIKKDYKAVNFEEGSGNRYRVNYGVGFDYETNFGLILGVQSNDKYGGITLAYNFHPLVCKTT